NYVRVSSSGTRHVSIDADNNVWVSGIGNRIFNKINGVTGAIMRTEGPVGIGGYGGLIDKNNVIWSSTAGPVLRWDTANPLSGAAGGNWQSIDMAGMYGYGLGIDPAGNVWVTSYGNGVISKFAPNGTLIGRYNEGNAFAQGCVADSKGDIWVAHSLNSSTTVGHLKNDGSYVGTVSVGTGPTGVAVDANGKIWATNYGGTVSRIDPNAGPLGPDGVTHVGAVDFTSGPLGGFLYNYSDMTGSTIQGAPNVGTWTATYDSGVPNVTWGTVDWNSIVSGNGVLGVKVATSNDNVNFSALVDAANGEIPVVPAGQYLKVVVSFTRAATGESPVLEDITVRANVNAAPVAEAGGPYSANEGSTINFDASASSDPDGDSLMFRWDVNSDGIFESDWSNQPTFSYTFEDDYTGNAALEVKDAEFTAADAANVTVNNVAPDVGEITVTSSCVKVNDPVNASASFSDPGVRDTHNATWDWGDGTTSNVDNVSGTAAGSHTYTAPGVYTIAVTVSDDDGGSDTASYQYVVVYDPSAGFVTGGGTIDSPPGAYANDPSLSGKANFGFVSKYQKGANVPTGVTEFQFKAGDLNFHSSSYEWLVVAGSKAMFKGTGTINGSGEYGFMISAVDGSPDLFRIKIVDKATDTVVYDNQMGADADANPSTALTGGNIVIHSK
ncbi:MAG: PKD domain-containing protein, partial [Candidatus Saccharibacteria bacterium]